MKPQQIKALAAAALASLTFGTAQAATYDVTYTTQGPTGYGDAPGILTTDDVDGTVTAVELPVLGPFFQVITGLVVTSSYVQGDDLLVFLSNDENDYFLIYRQWASGVLSGAFSLNLGEVDNYKTQGFGTYVAAEISQVPVPAAAPLLLAGLGALGFAARRRKSA